MKLSITLVALLFATLTAAQENNNLNSQNSPSRPVFAVKKTAVVGGESFHVARDKNNKLIFVKTVDSKIVHPINVRIAK